MNITEVKRNLFPCVKSYIQTQGGTVPENCCENSFEINLIDNALIIPSWNYGFSIPTFDDLLTQDRTQCKINKLDCLLCCNKLLSIIFQASGKTSLEMIQIVENVYGKDVFDIFSPI